MSNPALYDLAGTKAVLFFTKIEFDEVNGVGYNLEYLVNSVDSNLAEITIKTWGNSKILALEGTLVLISPILGKKGGSRIYGVNELIVKIRKNN